MHKSQLTKRQKQLKVIKSYLMRIGSYFLGLFIAIFLGFLAVQYMGNMTVIIDDSMTPSLQNEDTVLVNELSYKLGDPKRMDIVAIKIGTSSNSPTYVRRVIGIPGDMVSISGGNIYVNDALIQVSYNDSAVIDGGVASEGITLDEHSYFVMCDDYNNSRDDSRLDSIGTIDTDQIVGKVWFVWSPFSHFGFVK